MALLDKLKSLLGLDDGRPDDGRQGTDTVGVTVEHDPDGSDDAGESGGPEPERETNRESPPASPAPGNEEAVPDTAETDEGPGSSDPDVEPEVESPPAEDTVDESPEKLDDRGPAAESASGPAADADAETESEPEPAADADSGSGTDSDSEPETADSRSETGTSAEEEPDQEIRDIKGIGPSYATKLSEAGVESASDLAEADAGELSEETGLSEKRIQGWIDSAQSR